jgi:hypothetical protein
MEYRVSGGGGGDIPDWMGGTKNETK